MWASWMAVLPPPLQSAFSTTGSYSQMLWLDANQVGQHLWCTSLLPSSSYPLFSLLPMMTLFLQLFLPSSVSPFFPLFLPPFFHILFLPFPILPPSLTSSLPQLFPPSPPAQAGEAFLSVSSENSLGFFLLFRKATRASETDISPGYRKVIL